MGIGEPLLNMNNITYAYHYVKQETNFNRYKISIATMVPKNKLTQLNNFAILNSKEHCKVHYSIHSMFNRENLIPLGHNSEEVIKLMRQINKDYNTELELHYNLINKINDSIEEIKVLADQNIPVSFIRLSDTDELFQTPQSHVDILENMLKKEYPHLDFECYTPPGADIRASCGQFSTEIYGNRG